MKNTILLCLITIILLDSCETLNLVKPDIDTQIKFEVFDLGNVTFSSNTANIDSVRWDFGDGTWSNEKIAKKRYLDNGKWTVKYTAYKSKWKYNDSLKVEIKDFPKDTAFLSGLYFRTFSAGEVKDGKLQNLVRYIGTIKIAEFGQPEFNTIKHLSKRNRVFDFDIAYDFNDSLF